MVVTGTAVDYEILLADGTIDEDTAFEVVTPDEMRSILVTETARLYRRKLYDKFWEGYDFGKLDAASVPTPVPSPRWRRFFGRRPLSSYVV